MTAPERYLRRTNQRSIDDADRRPVGGEGGRHNLRTPCESAGWSCAGDGTLVRRGKMRGKKALEMAALAEEIKHHPLEPNRSEAWSGGVASRGDYR